MGGYFSKSIRVRGRFDSPDESQRAVVQKRLKVRQADGKDEFIHVMLLTHLEKGGTALRASFVQCTRHCKQALYMKAFSFDPVEAK